MGKMAAVTRNTEKWDETSGDSCGVLEDFFQFIWV